MVFSEIQKQAAVLQRTDSRIVSQPAAMSNENRLRRLIRGRSVNRNSFYRLSSLLRLL